MGRFPSLLVVASVLLVGTSSFQLGPRTFSSTRNYRLQLSDADQVSGNTSGDISELSTIAGASASESIESPAAEIAILSNPLVIENLQSFTEATKTTESVATIASAVDSVVAVQTAPVPVIIKDLKLAALAPAYPDDTSYMMCSACKAGR